MKENNNEYSNWLLDTVPYFEKVYPKDLEKLKILYDKFQRKLQISNDIMSKEQLSKSKVDYATSNDKVIEKQIIAKKNLYNYVNQLNEKYGHNEEFIIKNL